MIWFQITSRPLFGIGNGTAVLKLFKPLPPSVSVVWVAFFLMAANTSAGTVEPRWVLNTGILKVSG
ncbi:hypothetical protein D3C81_1959030 [compost metagenome]